MLQRFNTDLENAREAELLVRDVLASLASEYTFTWVGDQKEYRYRGDIIAAAANGKEIFIEVKDDECIASTKRVLCEEENFIKDGEYFLKGGMQNQTDIYCIVSKSERRFYVIDFQILKSLYKKYGEFKVIYHTEQDTYCYLLDLCRVKQFDGLITIINY